MTDKEHSSDVTIYTVHGDLLPHHVVAKTDYDLLSAEVAALREDAERYRWLRSPQSGQAGWWHIKYNVDPVKIDAAIDAARAAEIAEVKP